MLAAISITVSVIFWRISVMAETLVEILILGGVIYFRTYLAFYAILFLF